MKKYIVSICAVALLAAGCSSQPTAQTVNTPAPTQSTQPQTHPQNTPTIAPPPTPNPTVLVSISKLSPASGPVNTQVTMSGKGFVKTGNIITLSGKNTDGTTTTVTIKTDSSNGTTLTFTVPSKGPLPKCPPNAMCVPPPIAPGNYSVAVTNPNGVSNTAAFTITK